MRSASEPTPPVRADMGQGNLIHLDVKKLAWFDKPAIAPTTARRALRHDRQRHRLPQPSAREVPGLEHVSWAVYAYRSYPRPRASQPSVSTAASRSSNAAISSMRLVVSPSRRITA